jgi:septum site-determining protein MinD
MPCISVASGKGGVGKSVICANLAVVLSKLGHTVALIDADIEGSTLGLLLGYNLDGEATLHDYLAGSATEEEVVRGLTPTLSAVFGSVQLTALMRELDLERLSKLAHLLKERYDFVLIDTPPGFGDAAYAALRAGDLVIIVLNPDILSVTGALKVRIVARREGKRILGVVVNRAGGDYDIPAEELEAILEERVLAVIKDDPLVRTSLVEGVPLVTAYPEAPASLGIKELARRIVVSCQIAQRDG